MKPKKVFIIRPVRNVTEEIRIKISHYVAVLERQGYRVYNPECDNPHQESDHIGIKIIKHNFQEMLMADEIHIWYEKTSPGSIFDIGMFFAFVHAIDFKKFVIINREDIAPTPHKSFENVVLALEKEFNNPKANGLKERWEKAGSCE